MLSKLVRTFIVGILLVGLFILSTIVLAGSPDPGAGPSEPGSQMYTLDHIYHRLLTGAQPGIMTTFTEPSTGPGSGSMHTLNEIMSAAPVPDNVNGATAASVQSGKTFWGLTNGQWGLATGTAPTGNDVQGGNGQLSFAIPDGFYSGSKTCTASDTNLAAGNIRSGASIFGVSGSYVCPLAQVSCGGVCKDLATDRSSCGSCNNQCSAGQICVAGNCTLSCQPGLTICGGVCTNLLSDRAHCGSCYSACMSGYVCQAAACALSCQAGLSTCNGVCTNTSTDNNNCGACGKVCPTGTGCRFGTCS